MVQRYVFLGEGGKGETERERKERQNEQKG